MLCSKYRFKSFNSLEFINVELLSHFEATLSLSNVLRLLRMKKSCVAHFSYQWLYKTVYIFKVNDGIKGKKIGFLTEGFIGVEEDLAGIVRQAALTLKEAGRRCP